MNVLERVKAPTPKFFKVVRNVGISLATVSAAILAAPVVLPVTVVTIAGYAAVGGAVMMAVSQTAVDDRPKKVVKKRRSVRTQTSKNDADA